MRIGQNGIVFYNGDTRIGEITHIGENSAVLEFSDNRNGRKYSVSHSKDSIIILSEGIEKNTLCGFKEPNSAIRGSVGCIVEDISTNEITGDVECEIVSIKKAGENERWEFYKDRVLLETLVSVQYDSVYRWAGKYASGGVYSPENFESNILCRDCNQCGNTISVTRDFAQYLSGSNFIQEEASMCNVCRELEINIFKCKVCERNKPFKKSIRIGHNHRQCEILNSYDSICITCSRTVILCHNCWSVCDRDSLQIDDNILCEICSEQSIRLIYQHPSRTVRPRPFGSRGSFSKIKSRRHAGVEIECIHDWGGLSVPDGWRIVSDTSISDEQLGAEYVMTKPLNGNRLLEKIEELTKFIFTTGGYVDRSCGLHIHINGLDMELEQMKNCLAIGKSMETWIYDMLPADRKYSRYSKPLPDFDVKELMNVSTYNEFVRFWYYTISNTSISTGKYNESRYRGFNVHSRFINGTIEFRHHHGTLNFLTIEQWLSLCMAVVDTSFRLSRTSREILIDNPSEHSVSDFFYAIGLSSFNEHYNKMKEKTLTRKESQPPNEPTERAEWIDAEIFDDENMHIQSLGMVQERDSEIERM